MSTPVASKRPLSKMSASSIFRARLPVKVSRAGAAAVSGRVGRPWMFMGSALCSGLSQAISERLGISRAVVVRIRLRARDDDAIVEPGPGQKPRYRQSSDYAALRQSLDQRGSGSRRAHNELVEEMRVDDFDRRDCREPFGELRRIGVIDFRQAFEPNAAE